MVGCAVVGCKSESKKQDDLGPKLRFFRIPAIISENNCKFNKIKNFVSLSNERRNAWVRAIKRTDLTNNCRICNKHFIGGKPADLSEVNSPDWVPSQNLGYKIGFAIKTFNTSSIERYDRVKKRTQNKQKTSKTNEKKCNKVHEIEINDSNNKQIDAIENFQPKTNELSQDKVSEMDTTSSNNEQINALQVSVKDAEIRSLEEQLRIAMDKVDKLTKDNDFLNSEVLDLKKKQKKMEEIVDMVTKDNDYLRAEVLDLRKKQKKK